MLLRPCIQGYLTHFQSFTFMDIQIPITQAMAPRHPPHQSLRMPPAPASPGLLTVALCRFSNPTPPSCTEETRLSARN